MGDPNLLIIFDIYYLLIFICMTCGMRYSSRRRYNENRLMFVGNYMVF